MTDRVMDVNSLWTLEKDPTQRQARLQGGACPCRPCHLLPLLSRPPPSVGPSGGCFTIEAGAPWSPCLSFLMSHSSSFLRRSSEAVARSASVPLAVGILQGPRPTTPTVFAGPEPVNLSPFFNVYRISLLGTTYRGWHCCS